MQIPKELEFFFEMSDNGVCLVSTDGYFKKVNQAFMDFVGYDEEYLLSRPFMEIVHPDDHETTIEAAKRIGKSNQQTKGFVNRYLCKDGNYRWLLWVGKQHNGFYIGVATDITEQKELELTLEETAKLAHVGGWTFDLIHDKLTWSKEAYNIHEVPVSSPINVDQALAFYTADGLERITMAISECIQFGKTYDLELEITTHLGNIKHIRSIGRAKSVNDTVVEVFGVVQDITELKNREKELQTQHLLSIEASKLATLGEMAGGIAHEINNPLEIINVAAENIITSCAKEETCSKENILEKASKIKLTTMRIAKIIRGLKNISRDGSAEPLVVTNLNEIITDTLSLCSERFKQNNVDLIYNTQLAHQIELECSPVGISQVLLNLLNNSFDAVRGVDKKEIRLDMQLSDFAVQISIIDNGIGVKKDIRNKIMNPFFTSKPIGKGTGIGLSISNSIIGRHNGDLKYIPQKIGACFQITLPLKRKLKRAV